MLERSLSLSHTHTRKHTEVGYIEETTVIVHQSNKHG